jgi:phosphoesterase RecJ-like protein
MTAMLNTLELHLDGRLATQHILLSDFVRTGAEHKDTENLIDECRRIKTVEASALFVEAKDGRFRCSLRSRGAVDVGKIAQKFGGGGHKMAAGLFLSHPLEKAKKLIVAEITKQLKQPDGK